MTARSIDRSYSDPLDLLWLATARRIGFRVERTDDAFATSDGRGTIKIATRSHLDADDCLAQMIFHELCHSLVQGHESFELPDWGLENANLRDEILEHACLRAQAHLAARHGLRWVLAPTTNFRAFYDRLEDDPLAPRLEKSSQLARIAVGRAGRHPWSPHLEQALAATAAIAGAGTELWPAASLLAAYQSPPPLHPSGFHGGWIESRQCGECAWFGPDKTCIAAGVSLEAEQAACDRFEATARCEDCGACCREGYTSVTIESDDPVIGRHPDLVLDRGEYLELRREGPRCAALQGGPSDYACAIYADRPRCCRDLELGGEHCLTARRRVGLSI